MRFAIGEPASYRGPNAGSVVGIDAIHVEGEVDPIGAGGGGLDGTAHDSAETEFIDLTHREGRDATGSNIATFLLIDVSNADENGVLRENLGSETAEVR